MGKDEAQTNHFIGIDECRVFDVVFKGELVPGLEAQEPYDWQNILETSADE